MSRRSRDRCSPSPPPHRDARRTQTAATSPPPDSDSPSARAPEPNIRPAQTGSAPRRESPRVPHPVSAILRDSGDFPGTHPATKSQTSTPHRSNSASPTHSLPAPRMPICPAAAPRAHKSDQTISPDPRLKSAAQSQIPENVAPAPAATSAHTPPAPPSSPTETAGRAPGKSPASSDAPAPAAAPPAAACRSSPPRRAPAAPYSAPPTTDAAGTCCARRRSNTSPAPDRTPPRHPRARRRPPPPLRKSATVRLSISGVMPNCPHKSQSKSVTNEHRLQ